MSMKVAIVGFGAEGQVSCAYYLAQGYEITVCDQNTDITVPEGVGIQLGDTYLDNLNQFDIIVRTAGMHPQIILDKYPSLGDKLTTQVDEFMRVSPTPNIIGVTGTKGKGTTSTLIHDMLKAAGKHVLLGGNIGIPPLGFLHEVTEDSWVVLELSSFQLSSIHRSPHIAVCLMVVAEHLNWHTDMSEYLSAKQQLFIHQTSNDLAIYFADNETSRTIALAGDGQKIPFYKEPGAHVQDGKIMINDLEICQTSDIKLLGEHNWQNACAAVTTLWYAGIKNTDAMRDVLTSFAGLEHRIEFVRELHDIRYYNDSFGTTPETAMVALQAFEQPKVLILGGSSKESDYTQLARTLGTTNVRKVILIGNTTHPTYKTAAPAIEAAMQANSFDNYISLVQPGGCSMADIVSAAQQEAQPGDVILLSAACASFDIFTDYKDRGNQFKATVQALA